MMVVKNSLILRYNKGMRYWGLPLDFHDLFETVVVNIHPSK